MSAWAKIAFPCIVATLALSTTTRCSRSSATGATPVPSAVLDESAQLPGRDLVVVRADELVVEASRAKPDAAHALLVRAARLRARLWRIDGKHADRLEALELYQRAANVGLRDCAAELEAALLRAEGEESLGTTVSALRALRAGSQVRECEPNATVALATLGGFPAAPTEQAGAAPVPSSGKVGTVTPTVDVPKTAQQTTISGVEHYGSPKSARIVILMSRPSLFEVGELSNVGGKGHRLYVDILGADFRGPSQYEVGGLVEQVRLGQHGQGVRAVLDLKEAVTRRVFYLPEPFRLVLDVSLPEADVVGSGPSMRRVVLDPGHGGHDPGAIGPGGLREKDVALDVAHRAAPLIARELGVSALLTRDGDAFVPLDERVARANAFGADLFISIHCNSSESAEPRGVMTFVLDSSPDRVASSIAARENDASEEAAAELATAMSRMLDARSVARSSYFASLLQRSAMASLVAGYPDVPNGGVRRAGFYVLAGARMPAVLFEGSFISNPVDELRLDSPDYRQKLADSIVNAVRAFRDGAHVDP